MPCCPHFSLEVLWRIRETAATMRSHSPPAAAQLWGLFQGDWLKDIGLKCVAQTESKPLLPSLFGEASWPHVLKKKNTTNIDS